MNHNSLLEGMLVCPHCSGSIRIEKAAAACTACGASFGIHEGILMMVDERVDKAAPGGGAPTKSREAYEVRYQDLSNAVRYNAAYKQKLFKRWSTAREFQLLRRLLVSQPRSGVLLDLPCGGGRLTPALAPFSDVIIEADVAVGQVLHAKQSAVPGVGQIWMTASALKIPLRDNAIDASVCCRLSHHLPKSEERDQLVRELLRVSKRFVVMTYFDHHSVKNLFRRLSRPLNRKLPKMTMSYPQIARLAAEQNARLIAAPWLAPLSSGHRYALMVKLLP